MSGEDWNELLDCLRSAQWLLSEVSLIDAGEEGIDPDLVEEAAERVDSAIDALEAAGA